MEPGDGTSFEAQNANVWKWTDRTFSAQSLGDLGQGVTLSGTSFTNSTPLDLRGAVWVSGGRVWSLGDIKAGKSASVRGAGQNTSGADLPGAIANAANLDKIFDASTRSNGIPNSALQLALGDSFGKYNASALLIAWGKTPLAPIQIGDAHADNITLMIFRAPAAQLSGALAPRAATIKPLSFSPFDGDDAPGANAVTNVTANAGSGGSGYQIYDAILPAGDDLVLKARGLGIGPSNQTPSRPFGQGAMPAPTPKPKPKLQTWVHFEVLDARDGKWRQLDGELNRDNSPARGWNFRARIDPNMARVSDRLLRVRARLANERASVSGFNITRR